MLKRDPSLKKTLLWIAVVRRGRDKRWEEKITSKYKKGWGIGNVKS